MRPPSWRPLLVPDTQSSAAFIDALALRYALGLSAVIAMLSSRRPSCFGGSVLTAGGERLRARISHHLDEVAVTHSF